MIAKRATMIDLKRVRDLVHVFADLEGLYRHLGECLDRKLAAVREARVEAMAVYTEQQTALLQQIQQREGLRKQWMSNVAEVVGVSAKEARSMTVSHLLDYVPEDQRAAVKSAAEGLRAAVESVKTRHEMTARVTRGVLEHLGCVFARAFTADESVGTYTAKGIPASRSAALLLEAVG
jgi:phage I-like protein